MLNSKLDVKWVILQIIVIEKDKNKFWRVVVKETLQNGIM